MINIDKITLSKIVKESIDKFLKEELGIADEVNKVSNGIRDIIEKQWKTCKKEETEYGVFVRRGQFNYNIFGDDYKISYEVYNFKDINAYMENGGGINLGCAVSQENKAISLILLAISGEINENTFADSIQHEIEHIYQTKRQGKPLFPKQTNKKTGELEDNIYRMAADNLTNTENNGWVSKLANIIYYSRNEELDAFVNGLYGTMQHAGWEYGEETIVKNSTPYKIIGMMKELKSELEDNFNDDDFIKSAKFFGKKRRWFIAQAERTVWVCGEKIGKVVKKARKEGFFFNEAKVRWNSMIKPTILDPSKKLNENKNRKQ